MPDAGGHTTRLEHWLDRLRGGDEQARAELFAHAEERLRLLTRKMLRRYPRLRRWEETDDVLQNAILRLHRALAEVDPASPRHFYNLAAEMVRRELLDLSKHHFGPLGQAAHHHTEGVSTAAILDEPDTGDEPDTLEGWERFHRAARALPEAEREVANLLWYEGLTQEQVAEMLAVGLRTVKRRWQRARHLLAEALRETAAPRVEEIDAAVLVSGSVLARRYRLERILGEGGSGHVWHAHDLVTNGPVAVKVAKGPRPCFLAEAKRVARLRHPGIVPVREVGRHGTTDFLVADLVAGTDLATWLGQRRPTPDEAARLVAALARALDHAHQAGIVHRDVKPANILVDGQGNPHLTDFGIAVTQDDLARLDVDCAGTLTYMAPEQAACQARCIDARTDVYGLGVILYELLIGRPPFQAATSAAVRQQVLYHRPRPPRAIDPGVPEVLEAICLKCLEKGPPMRYRTASELAEALEQFLRTGQAGQAGPEKGAIDAD